MKNSPRTLTKLTLVYTGVFVVLFLIAGSVLAQPGPGPCDNVAPPGKGLCFAFNKALGCAAHLALSTSCRHVLDTYNRVADGNGDGQADVPMPGAPEFLQVSVGSVGCGVTGSGSVECWTAGNGTPLYTAPGGPFTQVSVGPDNFAACGVTGTTGSGSVECWIAGNGTPLYTAPGGPFTQVSVGPDIGISCGVTGSGSVDCWDDFTGAALYTVGF